MPKKVFHRILLIILVASVIPLVAGLVAVLSYRQSVVSQIRSTLLRGFSEAEHRIQKKVEAHMEALTRQKALDVALEVSLYLQQHPETLDEMVKDKELYNIAAQPLLSHGYTFLIAPDKNLAVAHPMPEVNGHDYTKFIANSPALIRMFKNAAKGHYASGFYNWAPPGSYGIKKRCFAFLVPLQERSRDGYLLVVGAKVETDSVMQSMRLSKGVFSGVALHTEKIMRSNLYRVMLPITLIILVVFLLSLGIAIRIGRGISRTIDSLLKGMKQVNQGDLSVRIQSFDSGELKDLTDAFNTMVSKLRETTISREFMESVIHSLPSGIALVDKNMKILFWNKAAGSITGFSEGEALGRTVCEVLQVFPPCKGCVEGAIPSEPLEGELAPVVKMAKTKEGRSLYVLSQFSRLGHISNSNVAGIVSFIDITVQHQLEQQLSHAQRMEAIGVLASGIAHDFNNMLGAILGNLNLITLTAEERGDYSEMAKYAESAEKVVQQASQITKRLLAFTRQAPVMMKVVDPRSVVEETVEILKRTIDRRISIETVYGEELWQVKADPSELQQVLMNLCLNAKDSLMDRIEGRCEHATGLKEDPPRILLSARNIMIEEDYVLQFPYAKTGRFVVFAVEDNGCGMDKEVLSKVFDPFFTTKEIDKGTGLGLATVYGLVKQHGGWIIVESERGIGSKFTFYIPAIDSRDGEEKKSDKKEDIKEVHKTSVRKLTILVADDEEIIRDIGNTVLGHLGHKVVLAKDGEEAVKLYKEVNPDLVFLDITMPVLSGKDALKLILDYDPQAKVIISSGHPFDSSAEELIRMGAKLYLQKPYKIKEIKEAVEKIAGL